jgi:hypothetical protein
LYVFDCFRKELESPAILFEKAQPGPIDLAVDEETDQTLMAQAGSEGKFSLRYVERGLGVAEPTVVKTRYVFEGRVTHGGVISIDV